MSLETKLERWLDAGLIDETVATNIRAFESGHDRPFALWAIIGLGLLALALGILSLIAANWDEIPTAMKLWVHGALTVAAAVLVWLGMRRDHHWLAEGALFILGALVLGGIALHAQIYQLSGPAYQALLLWLALMTPALLISGATRLTGYGWSIMAIVAFALTAFETSDTGFDLLVQGLAMAMPALLILLASLPQIGIGVHFRDGVREVGIVTALGAASAAHFAWANPLDLGDAGDMAVRFVIVALAAAAAWVASQRTGALPRLLLLPLLGAPVLAAALALVFPHEGGIFSRFVGALIFAAMWGLVARAANACGWRLLFGVAIAAIAIRIFLVYFELFGTLATTGLGLIVAGILLIALALLWRRLYDLVGTS